MPFVDPLSLEVKQPGAGWDGRFFHSEHMTFAYYEIADGASLHAHHHDNEEVWHVIEGSLDMVLDGESRRVAGGEAVIVPADVEHAVTRSHGCRVIVVDHPVRHNLAGLEI